MEVLFDDKGIPIIKGGSLGEIFEMVGYLQAKDRLFQLIFFLSAANGYLSSILGAGSDNEFLQSDVFQRTINPTDAELNDQFNKLDPFTQLIITSQVAGFQRRITEVNSNPALVPYEITLLRVSPGTCFPTPIPLYTRNEVLRTALYIDYEFASTLGPNQQLTALDLLTRLELAYGSPQAQEMFNDIYPIPGTIKVPDTVVPNNVCDAHCKNKKKLETNKDNNKKKLESNKDNKKKVLDVKFSVEREEINKITSRVSQKLDKIKKALHKIKVVPKGGSFAVVLAGCKTSTGNPMAIYGSQPVFQFPDFWWQVHIDAVKTANLQAHLFLSPCSVLTIPVGAAQNHFISLEVGNLPGQDYLFESTNNAVFNRNEVIQICGGAPFEFPVYRSTSMGFVIDFESSNIMLTLQDLFMNEYLNALKLNTVFLLGKDLNFIKNAVEDISFNSTMNGYHVLYADTEGNIAAFNTAGWVSLPLTVDRRIPLGVVQPVPPISAYQKKAGQVDINNKQGYYSDWNTLFREDNVWSGKFTLYYGELQRLFWINEYVNSKKVLTFEDVEKISQWVARANLSTGNSINFEGQDLPIGYADFYDYLLRPFFTEAVLANPTPERLTAIDILKCYKGFFIDGDKDHLVHSTDVSDKWILSNIWLLFVLHELLGPYSNTGPTGLEVINPLPADYGAVYPDFIPGVTSGGARYPTFLSLLPGINTFLGIGGSYTNLFLRILGATGCNNPLYFDWLNGRSMNDIIVTALDETLAYLGPQPWGIDARPIHPQNDFIPLPQLVNGEFVVTSTVHSNLYFNQTGEYFVLEATKCGLQHLRGMTPLGQDGNVSVQEIPPIPIPVAKFGIHAFDQAPYYESFNFRDLPQFESVTRLINSGNCKCKSKCKNKCKEKCKKC